MQPYIPWPPAADEIDELEDELTFGVAVWNASATSTDPARTAALLDQLVNELSTGDPSDDVSLRADVADLVARKRAMFPNDPRQIIGFELVSNGGNIELEVASAWYRKQA
jgi:hypothetical protein